jgi:hypothetical protein
MQDEVLASRRSRRRAWGNLQEIRWVLKDTTGVELPAPAKKTIDLEGRIVKDGVHKALRETLLPISFTPYGNIGSWQMKSR